jgi:hypothetical protein
MGLVSLLRLFPFSAFGSFLGARCSTQKARRSGLEVPAKGIDMTNDKADVGGFWIVSVNRPGEEGEKALRSQWQAIFDVAGSPARNAPDKFLHVVGVTLCLTEV